MGQIAQGQTSIKRPGHKWVHEHAPVCSGAPTDYVLKNLKIIHNILRMKQTADLEQGLSFMQKQNKVGHRAVSEATGFEAT